MYLDEGLISASGGTSVVDHRDGSALQEGRDRHLLSLRYLFAISTARHKYQLATVRYGFHRAP